MEYTLPTSFPVAKSEKKHPTVGPAFKTGKVAEQIFEAWLPVPWLCRVEDPDFFSDYTVEPVKDGEPTGRHFRAQIKGRTAKSKKEPIKESFETKTLRYYQRCNQPVFIFRIDPETRTGFWLFIQRYLKDKSVAEKVTRQRKVTICFDSKRSLENQELFLTEVDEAMKFMADEFPGNPIAAIAARQQQLEALDPRVKVAIKATDKEMHVTLHLKDPTQPLTAAFAAKLSPEALKTLRSGEPITIKAEDLSTDLPILQKLLAETQQDEIKIAATPHKVTGSVQISLNSKEAFSVLQVNGTLTATPKRLHFEGCLPEAPLQVICTWEGEDPTKFGKPTVTFGFPLKEWATQPLLSLANFEDLRTLFRGGTLGFRFLIRGQRLFQGMLPSDFFSAERRLPMLLSWLDKVRNAGKLFGINPPFPCEEKFSEFETQDVMLLVLLAENGKVEQSCEGETLEVVGTFPLEHLKVGLTIGSLNFSQPREVNFLGVIQWIGPLKYTFTKMTLLAIEELAADQRKIIWRGEAGAMQRIEV